MTSFFNFYTEKEEEMTKGLVKVPFGVELQKGPDNMFLELE